MNGLRTLALLLIGALLASARPLRDKAVPGVHVAVVLDASASMSKGDRLLQAREAVLATAATLGPTDRLSLVTFNGGSETLLRAQRPGRLELDALLQAVQPCGTTDLHQGLAAGQAALVGWPGPRRLVLVSDGWPALPANEPEEALRTARTLRAAGTRLSTIAIGNEAEAELRWMAQVGGWT